MKQAYLSVTDSAKHAGVSKQTIYRWEKAGLPVYRPSGNPRIKVSELENWIEGRMQC